MSANGKFRMGLNIRKSVGAAEMPKKMANIFGDESEDEEEQNTSDKFERKYATSAGAKARGQRIVEKELSENPDIFDYDTHFEQMQRQRDQKVEAQKEADKEKKPKYAHLLAKAHKQRELNKLLVEENTYKKEREKESGQFEDEEVFVTGAYRQQIEERERHKAEMEREEALEKMRDVRDQKMWQQAFNRTMLENISRGPLMEEGKMEEKEQGQTTEGTEKVAKVEVKEEKMDEGEEEEKRRKIKEKTEEENGKEGAERERRVKRREERGETPSKRERQQGTETEAGKEGHRRRRERTEEEEEGHRGSAERMDKALDDGRKRARKDDERRGGERGEQEEQKDEQTQRMERIRQLLAKRNDQNSIEAAKQRYLERRREGLIRAPRIEATE